MEFSSPILKFQSFKSQHNSGTK